MSAAIDSLRKITGGWGKKAQEQVTEFDKLGVKVALDFGSVARAEQLMNTIQFIKDPRNDADAKIQYLDDIIIYNYQYFALPDNPRLGILLAAWNGAMGIWEVLMEEKRKYYGNYARVMLEEPLALPDGTYQIMLHEMSLSAPTFMNQYFKYNSPEFKTEMQDKYGRQFKFEIIGQVSSTKELINAEIQQMQQGKPMSKMLKELSEPTLPMSARERDEEKLVWERVEYFGNVEMKHRAKTVLAWSYKEKHTYPNTPIVLHLGQQMGMTTGGRTPGEVPTFAGAATFKKSTKEAMATG